MKELIGKLSQFKIEKVKLRLLLLCLFLSTIFWIITKFSNTYSTLLTFEVEFVNIPEKYYITEIDNNEIQISASSTGFQLFLYKLFNYKIEAPLNRAQFDNGNGFFNVENQKIQIQNQFKNLTIQNIGTKEISFSYMPYQEKKVPVVLKNLITYKLGYYTLGKIKLNPDSITIRGIKNVIDTINYIYTKPLILEEISESFEKEIALEKIENVKFINDKITTEAIVTQFTDKTITLPIEIVNKPDSITLKLFPEEIKLTFTASIDKIGDIKTSSFKIIFDYNSIQENSNIKTIELNKKPDNIRNIRMEFSEVEYLIKK